jgi:hypothetical protein
VLPAIQCHVDKSVHCWYCGTYSHLHLGAPAEVGRDQLISTEDCRIMSEQKVLNLDGRQLPVTFHERAMVYFINGSVLYENMAVHGVDPQCKAEGIYLNNTFVPNTFQEVQVRAYLKQVFLKMLPDGSCFLGDQFVGTHCLNSQLRLGLDRIIIQNKSMEDRRYFSDFRTVKIVNVSLFTNFKMANNAGVQGVQHWLAISPHEFLGLELREELMFSEFLTDLSYFSTNIPDVFYWVTSVNRIFFPWMQEGEEDKDLLVQLTSSFHQVDQLLQTKQGCWENNLFHSNLKHVGNILIQHLGEMEIVSVCRKQWVNVTLGMKLPCYLGHFSLMINDTIVAVEPFTRLIKNVSLLTVVECKRNPVFVQVRPGLYVGNKGEGLQLTQVTQMEDSNLEVPVKYGHLFEKGNINFESVEETEYSELATNSHGFTVKLTEDWFVHMYNKTVTWLTDSWRHFLMAVIGAVGVVLSLLCMGCLGKLCNCIKFSWYPSGSP